MSKVTTLVPLEFGVAGRTGRLSLELDAALEPGLHRGPCMNGVVMQGEPGFLSTAKLAHRVAMTHFALSAGLSIKWCLCPCHGLNFPGLEGGSAGAAFLLALLKVGFGDFNRRALAHFGEIEEAITAVRLEWVAASAAIDECGKFLPVDPRALILKLKAQADERPESRVRVAAIAQEQGDVPLAPAPKIPGLFLFDAGVPDGPVPVLRASNADDCYRQLFRLQSGQVLL
ncbi:hypothetical protein [Paludibaculum fermentans]|uniref:hypothetical protein n=1 Tax=Paludibaculum fermentans TaxID=1473598 RepID=UPI003EBC1AE7